MKDSTFCQLFGIFGTVYPLAAPFFGLALPDSKAETLLIIAIISLCTAMVLRALGK